MVDKRSDTITLGAGVGLAVDRRRCRVSRRVGNRRRGGVGGGIGCGVGGGLAVGLE